MNEFDDIFLDTEKEREEISIPLFDKEEWIQQKKAERENAFEMIRQAAELTAGSAERVQSYLDLQSRFPRYSVGNILLLTVQKPDATCIGDFKSWKDGGASIKRGETGIILLEPGKEYERKDGSSGVSFNAKHVFDVSQTDAAAPAKPEIHRDERLLLKALVYNAPCEIKIDDAVHFPEGLAAVYDPKNRTIYVDRGHNAKELFQDISQELAHAHMDEGNYSREENTFTAFCVSYMLCKRCGIDVSNYHFDLPESFRLLDAKGIREELGKMRALSNNISSDMDRLYEKQIEVKDKEAAR